MGIDYSLFIVPRYREERARGLRSPAGLISGAALIMVAIFSGFAVGTRSPMAQFGFGMAVAIQLEATMVRSVLGPSTMKLLGDRNRYLPDFLSWLPQLQVEGDSATFDAALKTGD